MVPPENAIDSAEVFAAHADAWQTQGRLREQYGGGAASFEGWRLMASGLPFAHLNAGCVTDVLVADLEKARAWYRSRTPAWGALVPSGSLWPHGQLLLTHKLMAVGADAFSPTVPPSRLLLRRATAADEDVEIIARVDSAAFGSDSAGAREWLTPLCGIDEAEVAIAELDSAPVATGYAFRCDGDAGQTVYLGGIGVLPGARRRGIAAYLSSWLLSHGFHEGARFAHLQTDSEGAARVYTRLGFEEYNGIDIYGVA